MKMLIDSEPVDAISGEDFEVRNPATGKAIDRVPAGNAADVGRAADAAQDAFERWAAMPARERGKILFKGAQAVREQVKDLSVTLTMEQGKPLREARDEIQGFANILEYFAGVSSALEDRMVPLAHGQGKYGIIVRKPIGVCGGIIPWNVPAILMGWKIGPALAAGNTMVLKPASTTPLTNLALAYLLNWSGLPKGVLNVVTGRGDTVGEAIVSDPKIRKISFTGQVSTGRHVLEVASRSMKHVTLELGGSDPMIVCDDADMKQAVEGAVRGRFYNCGQVCTAVKRLYVFESIADEYVKQLQARVSSLKVGNGMEQGVDMGPLNNAQQLEKIKKIVDSIREKGEGNIIAGGRAPEGDGYDSGYFYMPTLVTDVPKDSKLLTEECFGPVLPVVVVKDLDDAIAQANDSKYGLGSSIWTKNMERASIACARLQSGITWVNQHTKIPPEMPFGGVKESGLGRENGLQSIDQYTEIKSILVNI
jgi:succinate-semialdehyde dehydrogenase/glutarate-semialdehyde dehydrogenase